MVTIPKKDHSLDVCIKAKEKELEAFKNFQVYEEATDYNQEKFLYRWVMMDKSNRKRTQVKARLVCQGFEEAIEVQADSPTENKETLRLLLSIAATKGWKIKSGDVKNAYLRENS